MSDYGADPNPDINIAQDFSFVKNFTPGSKTNVMQWTYDDDVTVQKFARRIDGTNILFKFDRQVFVDPPA